MLSKKELLFRNGMTLVELLITILVLTVGCLAAMRMMTTSSKTNSYANDSVIASILADSELERLKSLSREELANEAERGPKVEACLDGRGLENPGDCAGKRFERKVSYFPEALTTLSTEVEVEINWKSLGNHRRLVRSATITWLTI
jgi:prepilin-type N-terminal cleavage/methylation domain-containing protein